MEPGLIEGAPPVDPATYILAAGDSVDVTVRGEKELSRAVTIRPDGRVSLPLIEDIEAAGRTPVELARAIEAALSPYFRDPSVNVEVVRAGGDFSQQIRVIGIAATPRFAGGAPVIASRQAAPPRVVAFVEGITLLDVLNRIGGLSPYADGNSAYVLRRVYDGNTVQQPVRLDDLIEESDVTANIKMEPGDILVVPEGALAGDWTTTWGLGSFLTFTDNVNLVENDLKESAVIFSLTPNVSSRGSSRRVTGGLDATLRLNFRQVLDDNIFDTDEGLDPSLSLVSTSRAAVIPDVLFVDTDMSISQQDSTSRDTGSLLGDTQSASEFNTSGTAPTGSFRFSPYVPIRFGQYASAQVRYTLSSTIQGETDSNLLDTLTVTDLSSVRHRVSASVSSGDKTSDLGAWTLSTFAGIESRSETDFDRDDIGEAAVQLDWAYPILPRLAALATIGYQYRDGGSDEDLINAPLFAAGARWNPSRQMELTLTVGQRDERLNIAFNTRYRVTPRTQLFANYSEGLSTTAQLAADNVGFLGINPITGNFVDDRTDSAFAQSFPGTISTVTTFNRSLTTGASTTQGRNTFSGSFSVFSEESERDDASEDRISLQASWSRRLSTRASTSVSSSYIKDDLEASQDDRLTSRLSFNYSLYRTVRLSANYSLQKRWSDTSFRQFLENVGTVGVDATF